MSTTPNTSTHASASRSALRFPALIALFLALGAILWSPREPSAQSARYTVYASSPTLMSSTGRALAVATNSSNSVGASAHSFASTP